MVDAERKPQPNNLSHDSILSWLPQNPFIGPPLPAWMGVRWPQPPASREPQPPGLPCTPCYVTKVTITGLPQAEISSPVSTQEVAGKFLASKRPAKLSQAVRTHLVVDSLLKLKRHKRLKQSSLCTYEKRWRHFARVFELMPEELDPILDYLAQFDGETGRYKRDRQDLLNMLYQHAVDRFGMAKNPLKGVDRPRVTKKPIKTLSLEQVVLVDSTPQTLTERAAWELLIGHGWRQVEVRRITAEDVCNIQDGLIWCRGKERHELTPILPETQALLQLLTDTLPEKEPIFRGRRIRHGQTEPLGEDGMSQLVNRLFSRAGISYKGHDLRRTFATLVRQASRDEFLAMRLIRDIIPGQSKRYINFPMSELVEALQRYSPLRITRQNEAALDDARAAILSGGDGGESNSPSTGSYPEYTTSLVSFFILPG